MSQKFSLNPFDKCTLKLYHFSSNLDNIYLYQDTLSIVLLIIFFFSMLDMNGNKLDLITEQNIYFHSFIE